MTPCRSVCTAGPTSWTPVAMITAVSGYCCRMRSASHRPSWPGMRMSQSATAGGDVSSRPSASSAFAAVVTE